MRPLTEKGPREEPLGGGAREMTSSRREALWRRWLPFRCTLQEGDTVAGGMGGGCCSRDRKEQVHQAQVGRVRALSMEHRPRGGTWSRSDARKHPVAPEAPPGLPD